MCMYDWDFPEALGRRGVQVVQQDVRRDISGRALCWQAKVFLLPKP